MESAKPEKLGQRTKHHRPSDRPPPAAPYVLQLTPTARTHVLRERAGAVRNCSARSMRVRTQWCACSREKGCRFRVCESAGPEKGESWEADGDLRASIRNAASKRQQAGRGRRGRRGKGETRPQRHMASPCRALPHSTSLLSYAASLQYSSSMLSLTTT